LLPEQNWSRRVQFDGKSSYRKQWQQHDQSEPGTYQIKKTLGGAFNDCERSALQFDSYGASEGSR
jgi:hypothetical protein